MPAQRVGKVHAHFDYLPSAESVEELDVWRCECGQEFFAYGTPDENNIVKPAWNPLGDKAVNYFEVESAEAEPEAAPADEAVEPAGESSGE